MKIYTKLTIIAAAATALTACETLKTDTSTDAVAVETADSSIEFNLEEITCWEVLTAPEDATEYALTLLYGYAAGKSGERVQSGDRIESVVAAAATTCADNPDMPAYQAFE